MAWFGNKTIGSGWGNVRKIYASRANLSEDGTAQKITLYVSGWADGKKAKCALYDSAYNLVAVTEEKTASGLTTGWVDFDFPTPPELTAGDYWLAYQIEDGQGLQASVGAPFVLIYKGQAYGAFIDPLTWDSWNNNYSSAIYCTYEVPPPPSPNLTSRNNYNGYLAFIQQYIRHKVNGTTPWKNPDGTLIE